MLVLRRHTLLLLLLDHLRRHGHVMRSTADDGVVRVLLLHHLRWLPREIRRTADGGVVRVLLLHHLRWLPHPTVDDVAARL